MLVEEAIDIRTYKDGHSLCSCYNHNKIECQSLAALTLDTNKADLWYCLLHQLWGNRRHRCSFRRVTDSRAALANVKKVTESKGRLRSKHLENGDLLATIRLLGFKVQLYEGRFARYRLRAIRQLRECRQNYDIQHSTEQQSWWSSYMVSRSATEATINWLQWSCPQRSDIHIFERNLSSKSNRFTDETWQVFAFELFRRFYSRLSPSDQIWQTIFIYNQMACWPKGLPSSRSYGRTT